MYLGLRLGPKATVSYRIMVSRLIHPGSPGNRHAGLLAAATRHATIYSAGFDSHRGELTPVLLYCLTDIRSPCEFTVASIPCAGPRITALSSRGRESLSLG